VTERTKTSPDALNATFIEQNSKLRETNQKLLKLIETHEQQIAELRRMLFGQSSERLTMKTPEKILKQRKSGDPRERFSRRVSAKNKRKDKRRQLSELPCETIVHDLKQCPCCAADTLIDLGSADESDEVEFIPAHFVRRHHVRPRKKCESCGEISVAAAPDRVADRCQYGPAVHAHVAVSKCLDSIPLHRQAKQFSREGFEVSPSSLGDIFHRCAELMAPVAARILEQVSTSSHVNADETPLAMQAKERCKRGYVWTFLAEKAKLVGFIYSLSRSGKVVEEVLGNTLGTLQTDAYAGYNTVLVPSGRERVSCLGHIRRYFYKALQTSPEPAAAGLERILGLYEVEYEAVRKDIQGTDAHLRLRRSVLLPRMKSLEDWLEEIRPQYPPQSPLGRAIAYAQSNWPHLEPVLNDAKIRLDNNLAENALRLIALGRKNFLFVGSEEVGRNLAVLQTVISTCVANDVNPEAYLKDVLMWVGSTKSRDIDTLLPANWVEDAKLVRNQHR
jgi:transposase